MSRPYETVRYEVAGDGVATIALDQPETRNALSDRLLDELLAAFAAARDDDRVRCVVLTSTHETVFSSGGDSRASPPTFRWRTSMPRRSGSRGSSS